MDFESQVGKGGLSSYVAEQQQVESNINFIEI